MKIYWLNRFIPVPAFKGYGKHIGQSYGVAIRIAPEFFEDEGFIAHELTHVRQFYRTFGSHAFGYYFSKKYRQKAEVEAYKAQLATGKYIKELAANNLSTLYGLDITQSYAMSLLD